MGNNKSKHAKTTKLKAWVLSMEISIDERETIKLNWNTVMPSLDQKSMQVSWNCHLRRSHCPLSWESRRNRRRGRGEAWENPLSSRWIGPWPRLPRPPGTALSVEPTGVKSWMTTWPGGIGQAPLPCSQAERKTFQYLNSEILSNLLVSKYGRWNAKPRLS